MVDKIEDILSDRRKTHGDWNEGSRLEQNFMRVAQSSPVWPSLTDSQRSALFMILHKIRRILAGDPSTKDHWDDIAGYAKLEAANCPEMSVLVLSKRDRDFLIDYLRDGLDDPSVDGILWTICEKLKV